MSGYNVLRDGQKIATNVPGTSYSDNTAQPGTTYQYVVKAMDADWNVSDSSNLVDVTTPAGGDTTAAAVTISSPLNGSTINGRWITINTSATDAVGVTKMELFIDGKLIQTTNGNSVSYYWDTKKSPQRRSYHIGPSL